MGFNKGINVIVNNFLNRDDSDFKIIKDEETKNIHNSQTVEY